MKVKVQVQIDEGSTFNFEGEEKDLFKHDVDALLKSTNPSLSLKFGDSGNVVSVYLQKVKVN